MMFVGCSEKQNFKNGHLKHYTNDPVNMSLIQSFKKNTCDFGTVKFPVISFLVDGFAKYTWYFDDNEIKLRDEVYARLLSQVTS